MGQSLDRISRNETDTMARPGREETANFPPNPTQLKRKRKNKSKTRTEEPKTEIKDKKSSKRRRTAQDHPDLDTPTAEPVHDNAGDDRPGTPLEVDPEPVPEINTASNVAADEENLERTPADMSPSSLSPPPLSTTLPDDPYTPLLAFICGHDFMRHKQYPVPQSSRIQFVSDVREEAKELGYQSADVDRVLLDIKRYYLVDVGQADTFNNGAEFGIERTETTSLPEAQPQPQSQPAAVDKLSKDKRDKVLLSAEAFVKGDSVSDGRVFDRIASPNADTKPDEANSKKKSRPSTTQRRQRDKQKRKREPKRECSAELVKETPAMPKAKPSSDSKPVQSQPVSQSKMKFSDSGTDGTRKAPRKQSKKKRTNQNSSSQAPPTDAPFRSPRGTFREDPIVLDDPVLLDF